MRIRNKLPISLSVTTVLFAATLGVSASTALAEPDAATQARVVEAYGKLPLSFEVNRGQTDSQVKFLSRGRGYTLFLTSGGAVLALSKPDRNALALASRERASLMGFDPEQAEPPGIERSVLRMQLIGANSVARVTGLDELPGKRNYLIGNDPKQWHTDVPTYTRVRYEGIYPGIDQIYYGNQRELEYDFVVAPGAEPGRIRWRWEGAAGVRVDEATGNLRIVLHTATNGSAIQKPKREVIERAPVAWQAIDGQRVPVSARYKIAADGSIGFALGEYHSARPLTIDPVLEYSTYLGGSGDDGAVDVAVDTSGNWYVTGATTSINFPTVNPLQPALGGSNDAFVAKLNPAGSALVYSTYLGGNGFEGGLNIALDAAGNVYVTGDTFSTNFPTVNPLQPTPGGGRDSFVSKLNPSGSALVYSTYLGTGGLDSGRGLAVDAGGNAYVTGETSSSSFPTVNALQPAYGGGAHDVYVAKLNPSGSALVYSTFLGGNGDDRPGNEDALAVDASGNTYVAGTTTSTNFPTANPLQPAFGGGSFPGDAFVAKLNASGSTLVYSTYLGGSGADGGAVVAVDAGGSACVAGSTSSSDFPTVSPLQPTFGGGPLNGQGDAFVAKLNPGGSALVYSTYLGGSGLDVGLGVAVDAFGNCHAVGVTTSTNFPTANPLQPALGGGNDAFVAKLNPDGSALVYSTYLGGSGNEDIRNVTVDAVGDVYLPGGTGSSDFPTVNPLQPALGGGRDAFLAKITDNQPPVAFCRDVPVSADANCQASADVDNGSFDPDDDPITLDQSPPGPYGLGTTPVTLTVTDDQGASDSCMATVTVEDTTPPELAVTLTPDTLWPPNHRLIDVGASVIATDACSTPSVVLTSVTSNEADNGVGDGNTVDDIRGVDVGTADFELALRAERAGGGAGRIYTVVYSATDGSGNNAAAAGFAVVPHDQGGITEPIDLLLEENDNGTLASWTEAPGAVSYDVIRGQLGQIVETEVVIDLGTVVCIENGSLDASTLGWEDAALPNPGEAFFYLVEYYDGTTSSYGTESADKQRAPGAGDCQ